MVSGRVWANMVLIALLASGLVLEAAASVLPAKLKELRSRAELFERQADWEKACLAYEALLKADRNLGDIRERYNHCLRRFWQALRHRDPSFRKEVLSLEYGQALRLYNTVLHILQEESLDRKKASPEQFFRKGLEELRWALLDPVFCQAYVPSARPEEIRSFQDFLLKAWNPQPGFSRRETEKQVREVALAAQAILGLNPTVVVLEFASGACYSLDEHTVYLTPTQLRVLCHTLKGELVGVGVTLASRDNRLVVVEVQASSPAAEAAPPLVPGDVLLSIDKKSTGALTLAAAQDMLEGPSGTTVEVAVYSPALGTRVLALRRRALFFPSVSYNMVTEAIGYLHIADFKETTPQEIDTALSALNRVGMKALLLDLRGNSGGLFEAAIDTARRFLARGIIASTQNSDPKFNMIYQARNPAATTFPLVVLTDGDTASAAEVLAGALKENQRGRLVGQTTFGKGCTQVVLRLPPGPGGVPTGGLRLTVARFFSPTGISYSGRGVVPHLLVEPLPITDSMDGIDPQLDEARLEALRLLEANSR